MNFIERLNDCQKDSNSLLCVGLDSELSKIPISIKKANKDVPYHSMLAFNKKIVDATMSFVCAYKLNFGFYLREWVEGLMALSETISFIREKVPGIPIILDAKMADIGNSNEQYAAAAFDTIKADAVTVNPYLGGASLEPFLKRPDKGIAILCQTSNPGAEEFQGLKVINGQELRKLYQQVAYNVAHSWNRNDNCFLVVGATHTSELKLVRRIVGERMPILVPGIGAQQGDMEETLKAGLNKEGRGLIINSSRGIIFASKENDFAEVAGKKARQLQEQINKIRYGTKRGGKK